MPFTLEQFKEAKAFEAIEELYSLGTNYDYDQNPFLDFLDLIGYSKEEYGQNYHTESFLQAFELDYLADALKEYSKNPEDADEFVKLLLEEESK